MSFTLQLLQVPQDYQRLADLLSAIQGAPTSAADLAEEDRHIPPASNLSVDANGQVTGFSRVRYLALTPTGDAVGFAASWRAPWTPPGTVSSLFGVHPSARRQGIGTALVQAIEKWAQSIGADLLQSELPDQPDGIEAFIKRAGFRIDANVQSFILDLADWRPKDQHPRIEGVRFYTLAEVPADERRSVEAQLYALYAETLKDNPGHVGGLPPFATWRADALPEERTTPELVSLAADGDRLIGVSTLFRTDDPTVFYTDYTGIDGSYRGKGVARALKERSFAVARELGAQKMETETEASNRPMQQLNQRMGYKLAGGTYRIMKSLR